MCKCLSEGVVCCCCKCALSVLLSLICSSLVILALIGGAVYYFYYNDKHDNPAKDFQNDVGDAIEKAKDAINEFKRS